MEEIDCIFCKIVRGEIPSEKIYEDNKFVVFLDINPVSPGHSLVVPKEHFATFEDVPRRLIGSWFELAQKIGAALRQATAAPAFNVGVNNGRAAHQLVPHAHAHVIPRHEGDGLKDWPNKNCRNDEIKKIASQIRSALG